MNTNLLFKWFRREMAFFWLGMLMVPVFWIWWTLHPRFKSWERALAVKWTAIWIAFLWIRFDDLPSYFDAAATVFPSYCAAAAFLLWAVLFFRMFGIAALVLLDLFAHVLRWLVGASLPIESGVWPAIQLLLFLSLPLALNLYFNALCQELRRRKII